MFQHTGTTLDLKVQKRNGQLVEFNFNRIVNAIANAFKEYHGLPRESDLPSESVKDVNKIVECVVSFLKERGLNKESLTVEEIQDEVIRQLYENGYKEVGERYASYRRHHSSRRALFELYSAIKRNGKVVSFKPEKITLAVAKALQAHNNGFFNQILVEKAHELSEKVVAEIRSRWPEGKAINIEEIQDIVEKTVMSAGYHDVAKRYIIYREERTKIRRNKMQQMDESLEWVK